MQSMPRVVQDASDEVLALFFRSIERQHLVYACRDNLIKDRGLLDGLNKHMASKAARPSRHVIPRKHLKAFGVIMIAVHRAGKWRDALEAGKLFRGLKKV